jgi:hypothetical protein
MSVRRVVVAALAATVGVVAALVVAGSAGGRTLLAYVLFLGVLALLGLVARLRRALPPAAPFEQLVPRAPAPDGPIAQLERMERLVSAAGWSQTELHFRLRPVICEVTASRLSRRYGVDLEHEPERARAIVGAGRLWELVRPDRPAPEDRYGRGWSRHELDTLFGELERL